MATYSTGTPPTDATKLDNLQSVLNALPDNTSKSIVPKDIRDSIYTVWENSIFKPTTIPTSGNQYVGIDQDNIQNKIFFGKKKVNGQYVMNSDLLSTDVDIFFYNTKTNPSSDFDTTIAILSGTGPNYQYGDVSSPYLKSKVVSSVNGNYTNFEIGNTSYIFVGSTPSGGDINIESKWGNVSLNGVVFPTVAINQNVTDGYVLTYRKPSGGTPLAVWEAVATQSTSASIISSGTVSISGNPVLINGLNVNFSDSTPIPSAVGSIAVGQTFSNVPVVEMIRRILYPYIGPTLTTTVQTTGLGPAASIIIEAGNSSLVTNARLNYTITRSAATYSITSFSINESYTGVLPNPSTIGTGTTTGQVVPNIPNLGSTASYNSTSWITTLSDGTTTRTSSSTIKTVIPWYYGTSTASYINSGIINIFGTSSTNPGANKLTPIITDPAISSSSQFNKVVNLSGTGVYIYFGYPSDFPDLLQILDHNGFNITNSFSKYTITGMNAPVGSSGTWTNKSYKFYIYGGTGSPSITTLPTPYGAWSFKFA